MTLQDVVKAAAWMAAASAGAAILGLISHIATGLPIGWLTSLAIFDAWLCLYVGCAEEAMFRYLLMDRILERAWHVSSKVAMLISTLIFGLMHANPGASLTYNAGHVGVGLTGGAVFAYVYKRKGLVPAILLHAAYDFLVVFLVPVILGYPPRTL